MATTSAAALPNGIVKYSDYQAKQKATPVKEEMGQQQFLTLFTTQLKNQNPLDPVKNEAFVAQLAQFSQLEATTAMKTSMDTMVANMQADRMMSGAALIGRKVAVPDGWAVNANGQSVDAMVSLPAGADGMQVDVLDDLGRVVRTMSYGPQSAGDAPINWDGTDNAGAPLPDGKYRFVAKATALGKTGPVTVNTMSVVTGVSNAGTGDNTWLLQVAGGKTINLVDVKRVGY
ncbi:MAG: hypothetical protein EBT70_01430 [Betaproteobacteria bacterium]|nr:hypothetical protein [Betaproteobacteria bacterium]